MSTILYIVRRRIILKDNDNTTLHTMHNCVWAALSTGTSGEYLCHYLWVAVVTITKQKEIISSVILLWGRHPTWSVLLNALLMH